MDLVAEHFCVRDNISTRNKRTQGFFLNLYLDQYNPTFVLYSVFGPQSSFHTYFIPEPVSRFSGPKSHL